MSSFDRKAVTDKDALERRIDELCEEVERRKGEYAKLVDVLHEVEQEAIYAYHCLQQDCVTTANSSEHFFEKWWHAECELDRAKDENAKLRELVRDLYYETKSPSNHATQVELRMSELGIEVDE